MSITGGHDPQQTPIGFDLILKRADGLQLEIAFGKF